MLKNNIVEMESNRYYVRISSSITSKDIDNNCYNGGTRSRPFTDAGEKNWTEWQGLGNDVNGYKDVDPQYTDPNNGDLTVPIGSIVDGNGTTVDNDQILKAASVWPSNVILVTNPLGAEHIGGYEPS